MDLPNAMAVMCDDPVKSYKRALRYATHGGHDGRIATLPEIISARAFGVHDASSTWFTARSAIYFGVYDSRRCIAITHGTGPLESEEGMVLGYQKKSILVGTNDKRCATISRSTFVSCIEDESTRVINAEPYLFSDHDTGITCMRAVAGFPHPRKRFSYKEIADDPLILALFNNKAGLRNAYFGKTQRMAEDEYCKRGGVDLTDRPVCMLDFSDLFDSRGADWFWEQHIAGFITIGAITHQHPSPGDGHAGFVTTFDIQNAGTSATGRFLALRGYIKRLREIHSSINIDELDEMAKSVQRELDRLRLAITLSKIFSQEK